MIESTKNARDDGEHHFAAAVDEMPPAPHRDAPSVTAIEYIDPRFHHRVDSRGPRWQRTSHLRSGRSARSRISRRSPASAVRGGSSISSARRLRGSASGSGRRGCPTGSAPLISSRCHTPRVSACFARRSAPAPFLSLTHRLVVVRWREPDGKPQDPAVRADRRRACPAHAVLRAAERVDSCRIRARICASARRRDEPSAQRRHRGG